MKFDPNKIKKDILKFAAEKKRFVTIEEISRELKLSRPTIKKYLKELVKEGKIEEEK